MAITEFMNFVRLGLFPMQAGRHPPSSKFTRIKRLRCKAEFIPL